MTAGQGCCARVDEFGLARSSTRGPTVGRFVTFCKGFHFELITKVGFHFDIPQFRLKQKNIGV